MEERQALPSSGLMMQEYRSMDLGATDVVGVPLAAGTYRVVATNTTSLCSSSVTLVHGKRCECDPCDHAEYNYQ